MATQPRRWFRFRLRTMFLVVALAAVPLWQWSRVQRLRHLRYLHVLAWYGDLPTNGAWYPDDEARRAATEKACPYHLAMAEKYERAIWQPWVEWQSNPEKPSD